MNDHRIVPLLTLLKQKNGFVSCQYLGDALGISARTVRDILKNLMKEDCGASIRMCSGKGVCIEIENKSRLERYIKDNLKERREFPLSNEDRARYIVRKFLICDRQYIKSQVLADEMHISNHSFNLSLRSAKKMLNNYGLYLISRPYYGMKIQGSELAKREALAAFANDWVLKKLLEKIPRLKLDYINELAEKGIKAIEYGIGSSPFERLMARIQIMLYCVIIPGQSLQTEQMVLDLKLHSLEMEIARDILESIEKVVGIVFPPAEQKYLAVHLAAERIFSINELQEYDLSRFYELSDEIVNAIFKTMDIDFTEEFELHRDLVAHLMSMEGRLQNGIYIKNPIIGEIKEEYCIAYICASLAAGVLSRHYACLINDDETGYLALLFELYLKRQKDDNRKNILVVCNFGQSGAKNLLYELQKQFPGNIKNIRATTQIKLEAIDISEWDYIFTTIPLKKSYAIPTLLINPILKPDELRRIHNLFEQKQMPIHITEFFRPELFFPDIPCKTKDEVFDFMVERIGKIIAVPDCFKEYILKREENGRTELGSLIAIPHPYIPVTNDTFVAVAILSDPILWCREQVQLVFLISPSQYPDNQTEQLLKVIGRFLNCAGDINRLIRHSNYHTLIETLKKHINGGN